MVEQVVGLRAYFEVSKLRYIRNRLIAGDATLKKSGPSEHIRTGVAGNRCCLAGAFAVEVTANWEVEKQGVFIADRVQVFPIMLLSQDIRKNWATEGG